jgi:hypothetical protein
MKGWAGTYHACRDCGSDRRPHVADGRCTLCHLEHTGHTPTALEAALLDGAEPPLARAAGTNLPPEAPAPPARILPSRPATAHMESGAAVQLHADALARARARHAATFGPDATPPREPVVEAVVPLPEPERELIEEDAPARRDAPRTPRNPVAATMLAEVLADDAVAPAIEALPTPPPTPTPAPLHLVREEIAPGEAVAPASEAVPPPPPPPVALTLDAVPTDQLVAELRRRQEAARRAYEDALAAMESLDGALGALAAPAPARQLRGVA